MSEKKEVPLTRLTQIVMAIFLLSFTLGLSPGSAASFDAVNDFSELSIISQYKNLTDEEWGHDKIWRFKKPAESLCQVFLGNETAPRLELSYSPEQRLVKVTDTAEHLHNRSLVPGPQTVFLSHGYPAPYDDIATGILIDDSTVIDRRTIAGVAFAEDLTMHLEPVSQQQAVKMGFVRDSNLIRQGGQLYWVELYRQKQPLIRQLWHTNYSWWLYEETLERRSWLQSVQ